MNKPEYRMIKPGEVIEVDDEGQIDGVHWTPIGESGMILGLRFVPGFHRDLRRPLKKEGSMLPGNVRCMDCRCDGTGDCPGESPEQQARWRNAMNEDLMR